MKHAAALLLATTGLCGCAGNPLETNNITPDGRLYRNTEQTETGDSRTTVVMQAAKF